ncbi:MAG: hypothetical protein HYZ81_07465 [Nitrospinae bacterium]|nr:hypothetical protein [Nitrospinota bacterium]
MSTPVLPYYKRRSSVGSTLPLIAEELDMDPAMLYSPKAAEQMGALMFIHQGGATLVRQCSDRYHLPNTIRNT